MQDTLQIGPHALVVVDDEDERTIAVVVFRSGNRCQVLLGDDVLHGIVVGQYRSGHCLGLSVGGGIIPRLAFRYAEAEAAAPALFALHLHLSMVQVHVCLHYGESDAGSSHGVLGLVEAFEDVLPVGGRHSLACIFHGYRVSALGMLQRGGDSAFGRSVFQGIGHKIEVDMGHLLLVGDCHAVAFFPY